MDRKPCAFIGLGLRRGDNLVSSQLLCFLAVSGRLARPGWASRRLPGQRENFVFFLQIFDVPTASGASKPLYFHRFWASGRLRGRETLCILVGFGLPVGFGPPGGLRGSDWATQRHPGDSPSRDGPPGGSRGERKLCHRFWTFRRPGKRKKS